MANKTTETIVDLTRLNALSDGVFAIALTLLAFDIRIPENTLEGELSTTLAALAPKLLIYLISFIAIGGAWGSHQRMLSQLKRGDGLLLWFNLLSLLFITLLPASAALLGRFPSAFIPIVLFAADIILIQLTALWLWRHASQYGLLNTSLDPRLVRSVGRRLSLSAVCFALSVVLVVFNANLVYVGWIGLFIVIFTTDWLTWQQAIKTTQVAIPLDGAARGQIEITHGAGRLNMVSDATQDLLVQGTCSGDVSSHVTHEDHLLKTQLLPRAGQGFLNWHFPWAWELPVLDWNLSLNPRIPLELRIEKGAGELDLDLTKSQLTDLKVEIAATSISLRLPDNAGHTTVSIQTFKDSLVIYVPTGVAAHIQLSKGMSRPDVDVARFPMVEAETEYRSSDYDTATNRVDMHLELGLSSVKIS